ncbi:unnamed protein product [Prorocentrum cordatum]|uniref:Uncharacterized protein n=1 Tax=Prorocentrum cordatum TaxID=2364126 RepID=A0ABN9W7J1_9DINO|nr:unnamed protein product [Polarella glacialis]
MALCIMVTVPLPKPDGGLGPARLPAFAGASGARRRSRATRQVRRLTWHRAMRVRAGFSRGAGILDLAKFYDRVMMRSALSWLGKGRPLARRQNAAGDALARAPGGSAHAGLLEAKRSAAARRKTGSAAGDAETARILHLTLAESDIALERAAGARSVGCDASGGSELGASGAPAASSCRAAGLAKVMMRSALSWLGKGRPLARRQNAAGDACKAGLLEAKRSAAARRKTGSAAGDAETARIMHLTLAESDIALERAAGARNVGRDASGGRWLGASLIADPVVGAARSVGGARALLSLGERSARGGQVRWGPFEGRAAEPESATWSQAQEGTEGRGRRFRAGAGEASRPRPAARMGSCQFGYDAALAIERLARPEPARLAARGALEQGEGAGERLAGGLFSSGAGSDGSRAGWVFVLRREGGQVLRGARGAAPLARGPLRLARGGGDCAFHFLSSCSAAPMGALSNCVGAIRQATDIGHALAKGAATGRPRKRRWNELGGQGDAGATKAMAREPRSARATETERRAREGDEEVDCLANVGAEACRRNNLDGVSAALWQELEEVAGDQLEGQGKEPERRARPEEGTPGRGGAAYGRALALKLLQEVEKVYGVDEDWILALGGRAGGAKVEAATGEADGRGRLPSAAEDLGGGGVRSLLRWLPRDLARLRLDFKWCTLGDEVGGRQGRRRRRRRLLGGQGPASRRSLQGVVAFVLRRGGGRAPPAPVAPGISIGAFKIDWARAVGLGVGAEFTGALLRRLAGMLPGRSRAQKSGARAVAARLPSSLARLHLGLRGCGVGAAGITIPWWLSALWKWVCPAVLVGITIVTLLDNPDLMGATTSKPFPEGSGYLPIWSIKIGWLLGASPLIVCFAILILSDGAVGRMGKRISGKLSGKSMGSDSSEDG